MAQTKMLPTKISIKGEAKRQWSSAKTTYIYIYISSRKGKAEWQKDPRPGESRALGSLPISARLFMVYWHIPSCWVWVPHLQALVCSDGF